MQETEFEARADATLAALEQALDRLELDFELKPGGVLEVELEDGAKIIVNRHGAAREIWVAARAGGFHFRWDGSAWRDTRAGDELFQKLAALLSAHLGRRVSLLG